MTNLALFDFDGTISDRDSFLLFLRLLAGPCFYMRCARLAPQISAFLLHLYPRQRLKEDFLFSFLADMTIDALERSALDFCRLKIPDILRPQALERIRRHQQDGDRIIVVSATPELILRPWCDGHGLELLGTRLQVRQGKLTGKIEGRNCRGAEKVRRLREFCDLQSYTTIFAYGDSAGDRQLLAMADVSFYKPFRLVS